MTAKRTLEHAIDLYTGVLSTHMESLATKAYRHILESEREEQEREAQRLRREEEEAARQLEGGEEYD